jgi:hypothetical protein
MKVAIRIRRRFPDFWEQERSRSETPSGSSFELEKATRDGDSQAGALQRSASEATMQPSESAVAICKIMVGHRIKVDETGLSDDVKCVFRAWQRTFTRGIRRRCLIRG